ncbi:hypothetical protein QBC32DRAFT_332352 [Pseudoneurospora amorphoporcata]|uniref:Uncharacterized protein n=1 Tax=Pseudoneurospora amorphoporcata TaxID=241081 RepID=A0AAN6P1G3_9PEZI|nr:hypothetical protein QBC32DRAFT_332352 [Pseudoneurospora amorphoporcata]
MQAREGSKGTTHQAFLHVHGMGTAQRRISAGNDDDWSLLVVFEKENGFRSWM